jgi:deoxycytidylate deaminase
MIEKSFSDSELVLGLIGAVGTELQRVRDILDERLRVSNYVVEHVRITKDVLPRIVEPLPWGEGDQHSRLISLMNAGDEARRRSGDNSILALGAAAFINSRREEWGGEPSHRPRHAYIVSSLKHPSEVERLRAVYPQGFYLIGVHSEEDRRKKWLQEDKRITDSAKLDDLIRRDEHGQLEYGQRVADTFHLSDFFVRIDDDDSRLKRSLWRILGLAFGHPYVTPTFDEHAMFMAFAASLHSADLSRQVGAVVATEGQQVLATGTNDVPKAGGGQYWAASEKMPGDSAFPEDGRDFVRGHDSNKKELQRITEEILAKGKQVGLSTEKLQAVLLSSRIRDLTEFGRIVHAEMDALLSCARTGISTRGATLYATTFPCHNCAKHIVAAGIRRVVFIEPYPKSKAAEFHRDSIEVGFCPESASERQSSLVRFEPFVGVGPRRFFDLFSMHLSSGYRIRRKDAEGNRLKWEPEQGRLRLQMLPQSYLGLELVASDMFNKARAKKEEMDDEQT